MIILDPLHNILQVSHNILQVSDNPELLSQSILKILDFGFDLVSCPLLIHLNSEIKPLHRLFQLRPE